MTPKTASVAALAAVVILAFESASGAPLPAPDFTWSSGSGIVHLKDLHGHLVVVNFFATWCPPCRAETEYYVRTAHEYTSRGVYFVGVDTGDETVAQVTKFAQKYGIDYQLVVDTENIIGPAYSVRSLPTTVFVNARGVAVYHAVGQVSESELRGLIDGYLGTAR